MKSELESKVVEIDELTELIKFQKTKAETYTMNFAIYYSMVNGAINICIIRHLAYLCVNK